MSTPQPLSSADEDASPKSRCATGSRVAGGFWLAPLRGDRWRTSLLVGLLLAHLVVRLHHAHHVPLLGSRQDYSRCYSHALSLLLGRGFADLPTVGNDAAVPVDEFLGMRRPSLSPQELRAYAATTPPVGHDPWMGVFSALASTRVLDMHATALLWRVFGVSWSVVYAAGAVASTVTCLLVFLLGRRIGGGYWPGFLAAVAFFLSPMEKFMVAWSIRDTSPLWFAAGGFCLLACCIDRRTTPGRSVAAAFATGLVVGLGVGWRMDALLLVPFLACAIAAAVYVSTRRLSVSCASLVCFGAGLLTAHGTIAALSPAGRLSAGTGFHMAYYGDAIRSNMLGVENTAQVAWCDMQTLIAARRYAAANGSKELLEYLSPRYAAVCRDMHMRLVRHNVFRWVVAFPRVWWESLHGNSDDHANQPGWSAWRDSLLSAGDPFGWFVFDARWLMRRLPDIFSGLAVVGMVVALLGGPRRVSAATLAVFSVYFAAISFAVLPMQKHMAMMLVPACTFIGIGLWTVFGMLRPGTRRGWSDRFDSRTLRVAGGITALSLLLWGGACLVCFVISRAERAAQISSLLEMGRSGTPAPETVRGSRMFHVSIPVGSVNDDAGYLLTIRTQDARSSLVCRHRHVGRADFWPQVLRTRHTLLPGREQHFFVSCLQGGRFGDPRAYSCTVTLEGDAEIVSAVRVDFSAWDDLPVSTVFTSDDRSAGSPRTEGFSTLWEPVILPVYPRPPEDAHATLNFVGAMFQHPEPLPRGEATLTHLAVRTVATGIWKYLISDGTHFREQPVTGWRADRDWEVFRGDFDGDGVTDLVGHERTVGEWSILTTINGQARTYPLDGLRPSPICEHSTVADLNGDGLDDIVGLTEGGEWWAGLSDGRGLRRKKWGVWPASRPPSHVVAGDFDGDGRKDLAAYDTVGGRWVMLFSRASGFELLDAAGSETPRPASVAVADLDQDGRSDLVLLASDRSVHVGRVTTSSLRFSAAVVPDDAMPDLLCCGDFDGDGGAEPLIASSSDGVFWRGRNAGNELRFESCGAAGTPVRFVVSGDFTGSGLDSAAIVTDSNAIMVGGFKDGRLHFETWLEKAEDAIEASPLRIDSFPIAPPR